ncbi:hypothetical protein [Parasedimentitalea psychrophila]|uniref:Uncharacterized protein n=1 Tax=Parasedimentitalea psychrophila TaxID=2997337 RepID=A0A9Y2P632_9RHOB|nr:hypothetical protein [Parasedimentitalea psychrophila]WIY24573.1 hypothetical protein QPJ95_18930 [Parasedimentitalea psychrophila]
MTRILQVKSTAAAAIGVANRAGNIGGQICCGPTSTTTERDKSDV